MDSVEALLSQNGAPSGFIFFKENIATEISANVSTPVFYSDDKGDEGLWINTDADTEFLVIDSISQNDIFKFNVKANGWFPLGIRANQDIIAKSSVIANINILVAEDA